MRNRRKVKNILLYLILFAAILCGIVLVTTMLLKWYYKI
jgi:hypothetical protein